MRRSLTCLAIFLIVLFLEGCSATPPARHYFLTPLSAQERVETAVTDRAAALTVIVMPVRIPPHLDRPQIVTRTGSNEVYLDEFNRWTGSLRDNIADVLVQNLILLLPGARIARQPVPASLHVDYRVFVDILRFEGTPGQSSTLLATWELLPKGEQPAQGAAHGKYDRTLPMGVQGYDILVATQSRLLADLSREIAQALTNLQ